MSILWTGFGLIAVLLASGAVGGGTPVAPPPHPPLDELVTEYRRLGLPLPPPQADFVRFRGWPFGPPDGEIVSRLGFRIPAAPGSPAGYLYGTWHQDGIDPSTVVAAPTTVDALVATALYDQYLALAIQCRVRGWNDLAAELYARAREQEQAVDVTPLQALREQAWGYWEYGLTEPKSDWKVAHKHLRLLADSDEQFRAGENGALLYSLEAALFYKRTARPGTAEALIDDLIDHREDSTDRENPDGQEAYWKLAALGFDAVPTLLDHLHDDRLTRTYSMDLGLRHAHHVTVGVLCSRLVFLLSARQADPDFWDARGDYARSERATAWFSAARAGGEEKWLVDHALPAGGGGGIVNHPHSPEKVIVRALAAKYPARLPALYRAALKGPIADQLKDFVPEIVTSRLPRADVAALLAEGAAHPDLKHRCNALDGLVRVDRPVFNQLLSRTIAFAANDRKEFAQGIWQLADLVVREGDAACWDALATAQPRMLPGYRADVAVALGLVAPSDQPDPHRRRRLRMLLAMLGDRDRGENLPATVGDYAAVQLAAVLGLYPNRNPDYFVPHLDPELEPLSRFAYRCVVRHLAEQELAAGEIRRP